MVKRIPVSADRQAQLREYFGKNDPQHMRPALRDYVRSLHRQEPRGFFPIVTG